MRWPGVGHKTNVSVTIFSLVTDFLLSLFSQKNLSQQLSKVLNWLGYMISCEIRMVVLK